MRPLGPLNCVTRRLHPSSSCRWDILEFPGKGASQEGWKMKPDEATKGGTLSDYLEIQVFIGWMFYFFPQNLHFCLSRMKFIFLTRPVQAPPTFFRAK